MLALSIYLFYFNIFFSVKANTNRKRKNNKNNNSNNSNPIINTWQKKQNELERENQLADIQ